MITLIGASCGREDPPTGETLVDDAGQVAALAALPEGGLRYGVRDTGEIAEMDADGTVTAVASVAVSDDGQRGLLGLAVDSADRTFASWTRPDGRLVVAQVAPGAQRLVWRGPPSTDLGNGGHLVIDADDRLVIGVGDLEHHALADDPTAPNGKLFLLDPDGRPNQQPTLLSSGYTNPFAFTFTPAGDLWVFDNAVRDNPERLLRGDLPDATPAIEQLDEIAPSGLVALRDNRLAVCGVLSQRLDLIELADDGSAKVTNALATDCTFGAAVLTDGRVAYGDGQTIRAIEP